MRYITFKRLTLGLVLVGVLSSSCSEDFLEPTVSVSKDVNTSVNTVEDLQSLIIGALARMSTTEYYRRNYVVFAEVRSNNAFSSGNSGRFVGPGQLSYVPTDGAVTSMWTQIYSVIANANIVIDSEIEDNDSPQAKHVRGQAYALRALAYMDLLRVFGQQYSGGDLGVPLVLQFRDENIFPSRATVQETWDQIGEDLENAADLMDSSLNSATKTDVTTWMVYAMQSRYYLYVKDYENAAAAAKRVMDSGNFSILDSASYVDSWFSDGGSNRIFELAVVPADVNSFNTLYFIYQETAYGDIEVTQDLYDLYEVGDVRRDLYSVDGAKIRMVGKYPSLDYSDDIKVIRYAEVVLNYAEAMARLNNEVEALDALNSVSENRNAQTFADASVENVLDERRRELAMEGFGFFELVRNEMGIPYVDARQTFDTAGVPFGSYQLALPIPQQEVSANPEIDQNEGY